MDNFFQDSGGNRTYVDYASWDCDTVIVGGRFVKRRNNKEVQR